MSEICKTKHIYKESVPKLKAVELLVKEVSSAIIPISAAKY